MASMADPNAALGSARDDNAEGDGDGDEELLAWRTRLVERASRGIKRAISISPSNPTSSPRNSISLQALSNHPTLSISPRSSLAPHAYVQSMDNSIPHDGTVMGLSSLDMGSVPMDPRGTMSTADAVMQQHFAQPKVESGMLDSNNAMDQLVRPFIFADINA